MPTDDESYYRIFWNFGSFSYKSLIARSVELMSSFGSSYFLSLIDTGHLLAAGLITSVQNFVLRTGRLSLFGAPALLKTATNLQDEAMFLQQSRNFGLLMSIPMIAVYATSGKILIAFGQDREFASIVQDYFYGYSWGVPAVLFQVSNQQFLYFKKSPWTVCFLNAVQTALTLGVGAIFAFGVGALPAFGAKGLGHVTSAISWVMLVGTNLLLVRWYGAELKFKLTSLSKLKQVAKLGAPIAIQLGAELLSLTAAVQLCGLIDNNALAAAEATLQWAGYIIIPMQTLSQVANILISQELKDNKLSTAKKIGNMSPLVLAVFPALGLVISAIVGKDLAAVFINNHNFIDPIERSAILDTANTLMLCTAGTLVIDAVRTGLAGSLRGYSYTKVPAITGFLNLGVMALFLSYVMGMLLGTGAVGVFGARIIPTVIDSVILLGLWKMVSKRYAPAAAVPDNQSLTLSPPPSPPASSWRSYARFWSRGKTTIDQRRLLDHDHGAVQLPSNKL